MNRAIPLMDWAFSQPAKDAIVTEDAHYTWGELRDAILGAAAALQDRITIGTRVALYIDSTPNFMVYEYATFYLGGVVTPINRQLREGEVAELLAELGHELVISDTPLNIPVDNHVVSGEFDAPSLRGEAPIPASLPLSAPALLLQTSGSTGRPKGVVLTLGNLAANYDPTHRWLGVGKDDRTLITLPIFNTYALNQGINMLAMSGGTMRLMRRFSAELFQQALEEFQPTYVPLVPTMLNRLYQAGVVYDRPLTLFLGAAASAGEAVSRAWTVAPQASLIFGYGLTEGTAIAALNRVGTRASNNGDYASVGSAVPGVRLRLDTEGETETETDGRGEILLAGEAVFDSYLPIGHLRPVEDGWLRTGDIGRYDERGALHILDRRRDLIIRGGQNIYPGEIEHALCSHPQVLEAAVVAAHDDDLGEVPVAFVVARGADSDLNDLFEWLRPKLASYKVPVAAHVLDAMPKTPTGKIRKVDLRDAVAEGRYSAGGSSATPRAAAADS